MPRTFRFEFDELPLLIENGFNAGLIAGSADISYDPDGFWSIENVYLDAARKAHYSLEQRVAHELAQGRLPEAKRRVLDVYERKSVELDAGTPLFSMIIDTLEGAWSDTVMDAVQEQIAEDRAIAADDAADHRREQMMERV